MKKLDDFSFQNLDLGSEREGCVKQKDDETGGVFLKEMSDGLFDAVLIDSELLFPQPKSVTSGRVRRDHLYTDLINIHLHIKGPALGGGFICKPLWEGEPE